MFQKLFKLQPVIILINKVKVIIYLLGTLILFLFSLGSFIEQYQSDFNDSNNIPFLFLSIIGTFFFGFGVLVFGSYLFKRRGLIITNKIEDYSGLFKIKTLLLKEIKSFSIGYASVIHPIKLVSSKPIKYLEVTLKGEINGKKKYIIKSQFLHTKPEELLFILNERLKEYNS